MDSEYMSLTAYLAAKRGLDPANFQNIISYFGDKGVEEGGSYGVTWVSDIKDIKIFDDLIVVLCNTSYLSGWPGIRRETRTLIFRSGESQPSLVCVDVYVDGARNTRHLDKYDRAFTKILSVRSNDDCVEVRVQGPHNAHYITCLPSAVTD